jgi:DNA-nicking Smr family endonuclease
MDDNDKIIAIPIDGVLDLHLFQPREVHSLIDDYLALCLERGIYDVRIIHGKGKGVLRDITHSILRKNPLVLDFRLDSGSSGWGATLVRLKQ